MSQLCVRFGPETTDKLRQRAADKEIAVAHYIRNLVDLGMKVEDASNDKNKDSDNDQAMKELQIKSYKATIETLFIIRRLVNYTNNSTDNSEDILKLVSEKAQSYIEGYLGEKI